MGTRIAIEVPGVGPVGGWLAEPAQPQRGALVVIQEIFGVNAHMRDVTDRYAGEGYLALAPAMFDPIERDVELDYDDAGFAHGRELAAAIGFERAIAIVGAAADTLRARAAVAETQRIGAVGFCWGGSVAYLANTRLGLPAVSYYGARTVPFLDEPLRAPMMFHFGARDSSIPPPDIEAHRRAKPDAEIHVYDGAGHAFNRDVDPRHFHADSAKRAHERTLGFFAGSLCENKQS